MTRNLAFGWRASASTWPARRWPRGWLPCPSSWVPWRSPGPPGTTTESRRWVRRSL